MTRLTQKKSQRFLELSLLCAILMAKLIQAPEAAGNRDCGVSLTCNGLRRVNWNVYDDDFEFVFGEDRVCRVHSVMAEFLSPKIARLRMNDPLCYFYRFPCDSLKVFTAFEGLVSNLKSGSPFQVDITNFSSLLRLCHELENDDLLSFLFSKVESESCNLDESLVMLRFGLDLGTAFEDRFLRLRDSVASHFHEIKKDVLNALDLEVVGLLLSSSSLKIEDEDSLYEYIKARTENDIRFSSLFEFVYFEYLSLDRVKDFCSFASDYFLDNINGGIWSRICGRLIHTTGLEKSSRSIRWKEIECPLQATPLNGIIAHLTRKYGNLQTNGLVEVTHRHPRRDRQSRNPAAVLEFTSSDGCELVHDDTSWICYDFKDRRVFPTSIALGRGCQPGSFWPAVLEVSNDGISWIKCQRVDSTGQFGVENVSLTPLPDGRYRFVRLRSKRDPPNHYRCDPTPPCVSAFEIYGVLFEQ